MIISLRSKDAYVHQLSAIIGSADVFFFFGLFGTNPFTEPILTYCLMDRYTQTSVKFELKYISKIQAILFRLSMC